MTAVKVFNAQTANADSAIVNVNANKIHQRVAFAAVGTWGSGTIKLQAQLPDETTWVDVASATLTANGSKVSTDVVATKFRLNLAGATSPNLNAWIIVDDTSAETTVSSH